MEARRIPLPRHSIRRRRFLSIAAIVIVYLVGLIGLPSEYRETFTALTPVTLLFSGVVLFINHKQWNPSFLVFLVTAFMVGYLVEVLGVKTGVVFGEYEYGATLGPKLWDVPLIIGLNWAMLIYSCGVVLERFQARLLPRTALGATLMVMLDILMEPVAIDYDFWSWTTGEIPVQNYLAWFVVSFGLLLLFNLMRFNKVNVVGEWFFGTQMVFFGLMIALEK